MVVTTNGKYRMICGEPILRNTHVHVLPSLVTISGLIVGRTIKTKSLVSMTNCLHPNQLCSLKDSIVVRSWRTTSGGQAPWNSLSKCWKNSAIPKHPEMVVKRSRRSWFSVCSYFQISISSQYFTLSTAKNMTEKFPGWCLDDLGATSRSCNLQQVLPTYLTGMHGTTRYPGQKHAESPVGRWEIG